MAVMLMAKAFSMKVGNAGKKLVLLKLADNANDNGECWPSYQHIADQCEISKRSAMSYINELINDGLIQKRSRKGAKGNGTNIYVVNLDGESAAPPSESAAPPSESAAPGGSESAAPGISHSFESVSESVNKNTYAPTKTRAGQQSKPSVSPGSASKINFSSWPELPDDQILKDWLDARRKARATHSQTAINAIGKELHKAVAMGYTVNQCGEEAATRGWRGFKAEWMQNSVVPANRNGVALTGNVTRFPGRQSVDDHNREVARRWAAGGDCYDQE